MDHLYGVKDLDIFVLYEFELIFLDIQASCKLIHVPRGTSVLDHVPTLLAHFNDIGSPVMIGNSILINELTHYCLTTIVYILKSFFD